MAGPTTVSSSRAVPAPLDETYHHTIELPLPEMFSRRYLAVPGVTRVEQHDPGPWGTVGQSRTIHLADGGTMTETLTRCDRPVAFGYDITDLRGALSPLVERIEGLYAFEKAGTGTRVTWSWVAFFAFMGVANWYVAFHYSLDTWVNFKVWGGIGLFLTFALIQGLLLARHLTTEESR